jgi:putative alpha-1,2-mannosidase
LLSDLCEINAADIDWDWALCHMDADLRRTYGEEFMLRGVVHPISHTLDLAIACECTAKIARYLGDGQLAEQLDRLAGQWVNAFDFETGLLVDSSYYEGGKWNYSFRLLPDMVTRVRLAGGDEKFAGMLDAFFGYGAEPVRQVGVRPTLDELANGFALNRFQGLNNEPDMDAPWAYHYIGRPDRTAEVVQTAINNQFGLGRGGLPGNDDSGGLSSWYVWASLGLFPVAGQSLFLLNAPSFQSARMNVGNQELSIETSGFVEPDREGPAQYVQSVSFNGEPLDRTWLAARDLYRGGQLHFELGQTPSDWGRSSRPSSVTGADREAE